MNKEIAELWANRLPGYKQTKRSLCKGDEFCCLGVLCELAIEAGVEISKKPSQLYGTKGGEDFYSKASYNYDESYPPASVIEWAGMRSREGQFGGPIDAASLVELNDSGSSFEEISKVIKENWEIL